MSAGYGRGYYGCQQLAPRQLAASQRVDYQQLAPRRRPGTNWFGALLLIGIGAAVWLAWPSKTVLPELEPPPPRGVTLEQLARARGFSSLQAFEDAVIANARELRATGAHVDLGPHLAHLDPRVGS
jgi:hypothetical protein